MSIQMLSDKDTIKALAPDLKNLSDDDLDLFLEVGSSIIQQWTGRYLRKKWYSYVSTSSNYNPDKAIASGDGRYKLYLPEWPIRQVTVVYVDNELKTVTDISDPANYDATDVVRIYKDAGYLHLDTGWNYGLKNIHLVYEAGYDSGSYPEEYRAIDAIMAQLCVAIKALLEKSAGVYREERIGKYSYAIGYDAQYIMGEMMNTIIPGHPIIATMLEQFVRPTNRPRQFR